MSNGFLAGLQGAFARAFESGAAADRRAAQRAEQQSAGWSVTVEGLDEPWNVQAADAADAMKQARRKFGSRALGVAPAIVWTAPAEDFDRNLTEPGWREKSEQDEDRPSGLASLLGGR